MAKKRINRAPAKGFANGIAEDLIDEITMQYNQLIKETITDLTFGEYKGRPVSPILTGFFASSWKANKNPISNVDDIKGYNPWAKIKRKGTGLAPGYKPIIKLRHYIPKNFRTKDTVYIGNTVRYTQYALQSPKNKILDYVLGASGLDQKISTIFNDKNRPDLRLAADSSAPYQQV